MNFKSSLALVGALLALFVSSPSFAAKSHSNGSWTNWDFYFGGIQEGTMNLGGDIGYSNLPRIFFEYGIVDQFSLGAIYQFDIMYYTPSGGVNVNMEVGIPLRVSFYNGSRLTAGMRMIPAFAMGFTGGFTPGVMFDLETNVGARFADIFTLGGGLNVPFLLAFGESTGAAIPILFGPAFEIHPIRELGIGLDTKFGPFIAVNNGTTVLFGMRLGANLTYHF